RREIDAGLNSPRGEHEIGGVLFGKHYPDRVRILDCRLLQCEYAMGPGFVLSERDKKLLAELIVSAATDRELRGLTAVGWYHSHIQSRIFLSERDLHIHS